MGGSSDREMSGGAYLTAASPMNSCSSASASPLLPHHAQHPPPPFFYVQSPSRDSSASNTTNHPLLLSDIPIHDAVDTSPDAHHIIKFSTSSTSSSPLFSFFHRTSSARAAIGEPLHTFHHRRTLGLHDHASLTPSSPDQSSTTSLQLSGIKRVVVPQKWAQVVAEESGDEFPAGENEYGAWDLNNRKLLFFWFRVYAIALICTVLCSFLLMWLACTPPRSPATVQDISFLYFTLIHGSDRSLVPTDMLLVDSNVTMELHNPSKYFHLHFHRTVLTFSYMEIPIARGKALSYDLNRGSTKSMLVKMNSEDAPLYGAGIDFEASGDEVTVRLDVSMDMLVSILWNALRRRFSREMTCNFKINVATLILLNLTCS